MNARTPAQAIQDLKVDRATLEFATTRRSLREGALGVAEAETLLRQRLRNAGLDRDAVDSGVRKAYSSL